MKHKHTISLFVGVLSLVALSCSPSEGSHSHTTEETMHQHATGDAMHHHTTAIEIPKSIQVEHGAIHAALVEATKAPGRVGIAAKELADVLHPHFVREEQIALPPLGLLEALASNTPVPDSILTAALAMSDALKAELPQMLEEHKHIRAAVEKLLTVAREEKATQAISVAEQLALHAQSEEEVFYPTAILVGDIIRARQQHK